MDSNVGLFGRLPLEIIDLIYQDLSMKDGYYLATTCQYFADLILSENGWNWHKLGEKLQIEKVTIKKPIFQKIKKKLHKKAPNFSKNSKKKEVIKFIKYFQKKEDPTFYNESLELQNIKLQLKMRPPLEKAIDNMKNATLYGKEDPQTFDSLAPVVLPFIKDNDTLKELYSFAISNLPKKTIDKMLEIKPINLANPHFQDYISRSFPLPSSSCISLVHLKQRSGLSFIKG